MLGSSTETKSKTRSRDASGGATTEQKSNTKVGTTDSIGSATTGAENGTQNSKSSGGTSKQSGETFYEGPTDNH
ncbi:hypothetical protein FHT77_002560 [Rhizobium sp. BK181]|uniref:hypothetical protein n=1 Tax=Rhizobium sp. BK181 TaxID=2587072 RepID=UPI00160F466C|nr:hypothetical protein [Rhizobium sp. BK181]MBB3316679.1 hypothetical protein [Rhizobium sp. BK181]